MTDQRQSHWQDVYTAKAETAVSWFQEQPTPSLDLLDLVGAEPSWALIDIGGGASRLVDELLARGYGRVTVLDLSSAALEASRGRLGSDAGRVRWIVADVTDWEPSETYDLWHDRAAFHFLTRESEQVAYVDRVKRSLRPGGILIIGTFALDGPEKCSGLPVARHNGASLARLLGPAFRLTDERRHDHVTPWNAIQHFQFGTFRHVG